MKVCILSAGPSISRIPPCEFEQYDARIAVNRAIMRHRAEWLVAGDAKTVEDCTKAGAMPSRGVVGSPAALRALDPRFTHLDKIDYNRHPMLDVLRSCSEDVLFGGYSLVLALAFCGPVQVKSVDIYGNDRSGAHDPAYEDDKSFREQKRWEREGRDVASVCMELSQRGVQVTDRTTHVTWRRHEERPQPDAAQA